MRDIRGALEARLTVSSQTRYLQDPPGPGFESFARLRWFECSVLCVAISAVHSSRSVTHCNARRVADGKEVPAAAGDIALASSHGETRVAEDAVEASVHIAESLVAAAAGRSAASPLVEGRELTLDDSQAGLVDAAVTFHEGGSFYGRDFGDGSTVDAHGDRGDAG
jgi:hypothetical protein